MGARGCTFVVGLPDLSHVSLRVSATDEGSRVLFPVDPRLPVASRERPVTCEDRAQPTGEAGSVMIKGSPVSNPAEGSCHPVDRGGETTGSFYFHSHINPCRGPFW